MAAKLPLEHDGAISTKSPLRNDENENEKFDNADRGQLSDRETVESKLDALVKIAQMPDVKVPTNHSSSSNSASQPNNLQLTVSIDSSPRNKSPITVQEWVDSLPLTPAESSREECDISDKNVVSLGDCDTDNLTLGAEAGCLVEKRAAQQEAQLSQSQPPMAPAPVPALVNVTITGCAEPSEVESHCSSVDSLLEARKPDPEEVLLSLGFGGTASSSYLETGRIPKRFLQQSQLKGVDIEEFIRQQQDLIYTFESGYYGYRGLAGPSHSNPSVIVAKILEKLREHERETASTTSYQLDFRKRCFLDKNHAEKAVTNNNKFSKVARNVLTKIRCTPSSVLNPDNRRWLDSQGSKSPEIARRLIIGQKSFTFGRDGDLIEASNININNNNQINSNQRENSHLEKEQRQPEHESADNITDKLELGRRFTDSSTDVSIDSIIVKNDCSRPHFCDSLHDDGCRREETRSRTVDRSCTLKRVSHVDVDEPSSMDLCASPCDVEAVENRRCDSQSSQSSVCTNRGVADFISRQYEIETNVSGQPATCSKEMSLREELFHSGIGIGIGIAVPDADLDKSRVVAGSCSLKKLNNVLTRCNSFEESGRENSQDDEDDEDETTNMMESRSASDCPYSDSATESEFASYPHRSLANKAIHRQYEELILLESVLHSIGRPVTVISKHHFYAVSSEQRGAIQIQMIREALKAYLYQMTEDEIHSELKNCLSAEVQKVADLLDSRCDASKLAVVVKQMTLLLQHQSQLSTQIKELTVVDKKPTSCHEMCDQVLKRVHDLELLVQQNAQELAQMKNQLLRKDE